MAKDLSDHEKLYFQKMFDLYDTDKSHAIGPPELRNLAKHLGVEISNDALLASVQSIGVSTTNGEFDLSFNEFLRWLSSAQSSGGDEFALLKAKITAQGSKALNNEQIARLKEVFNEFDADGSGSIDAQELNNVFVSMGQEMSPEQIEKLIVSVDDDHSGQIEFGEFMLLMCSNFGGQTFAADMRKAFETYDPESTGLITVEDLMAMMRDKAGGLIGDKELKEIVASCDCIKDGRWVEYMKWEALWDACDES